jgi:hypothetical protein
MRKVSQFSVLFYLIGFLIISCLSVVEGYAQYAVNSQWVASVPNGRLVYKALDKGDKIMDFSFAGYMGGGVMIPDIPVKLTVPDGVDDATLIQNAIDKISNMKLSDGFRGTVFLAAGTFNCDKTINITADGVVLRGSGSGPEGTVINMTGEPHTCISIKGSGSVTETGEPVRISDAYVPSGATSFTISDVTGLAVGDNIRISRPVTDLWVHFMGMDSLVRDGKKQTWISGETLTERTILKIDGKRLTVDVPLTDSFDAAFLGNDGATVVKIISEGVLSQVGVENLRVISPPRVVTITERSNKAINISRTQDSWLKNLEIVNTVNSIGIGGNRITVQNVRIMHTVATEGSAKPADFTAGGRQILFDRCSVKGDNLFFFVTGARVSGPIVLLNCLFKGNGWIQPHARWATGLLVDGCEVPEGGIDFMNRGEMGSGHGWTIGWAVAWNCKAKRYINQMPPGAANWVIGCTGEREKMAVPFDKLPLLPEGIYDSQGSPVVPSSLYLAQLSERLGAMSLKNIGYDSSTSK